MASIPLNIARRGLDTGNTVSYPAGSPLGAAVTGFGNTLSAIGERHREMQEQQERLAAAVQRRLFTERVAEAESQALTNSPPDGSGLHEALYGQVDPISGEVVKPGQYDLIVNDVLEQVPSSQRAAFVRHAQAERPIGARRAAQAQLQLRGAYENDQWEQARGAWLTSIAGGDPDNEAAFQARRRDGLDFLATMALDPQIRLQAQKGGKDFEVVAINIDTGSDDKPRNFLKEIGVKNLPLRRDATMASFNELKRENLAFGLPVTLLVDRKGCQIAAMNGPAPWDGPDAAKLIDAAKAF